MSCALGGGCICIYSTSNKIPGVVEIVLDKIPEMSEETASESGGNAIARDELKGSLRITTEETDTVTGETETGNTERLKQTRPTPLHLEDTPPAGRESRFFPQDLLGLDGVDTVARDLLLGVMF